MDTCGIYGIICVATGKVYVGSSMDIPSRWKGHRRALQKGKHTSTILQRAWRAHGEQAFEFYVIEICARDDLVVREQFHIDRLRPALNTIKVIHPVREMTQSMREKATASLRVRAALITHCPWGHRYDEANTHINKKGKRICRACSLMRIKQVYAAETPAQREHRRAMVKAAYMRQRADRLIKGREYAAKHKDVKREYDRRRRESRRAGITLA